MDTSDRDDAPPACLDHAACSGMHTHEGAVEVRIQGLGPGFDVQVQELDPVAGAGIIGKTSSPPSSSASESMTAALIQLPGLAFWGTASAIPAGNPGLPIVDQRERWQWAVPATF
jgi:hypothetical protein